MNLPAAFIVLFLCINYSFGTTLTLAPELHLNRRDLKSEFGNYVVYRNGTKFYEEAPTFVRIGMKALFGGWFVLSPFVRFQLRLQTSKRGAYYDSDKSKPDIKWFIKAYHINLDELLEKDPNKYENFNHFFYRKLKPGARPIDSKDDDKVFVSVADSRVTVFETVDDATKFWIKGKDFNLENFFSSKDLAKEFDGGSMALFRLAPQDYHRFHAPTKCKVESVKEIAGEYYTVNPMAIRSDLNVLSDNKRVVMVMSTAYGKMAFVSVGALMVASIKFTGGVVGKELQKGDEVGYFGYGGSTVAIVMQKGRMKWDPDLVATSKQSLETLLRMGEHVGKAK